MNYTHMLPDWAQKRIRPVEIHYHNDYAILGFMFFDKDKALLWKILYFCFRGLDVETVELADGEVIIDVAAKLYPGMQTRYSDF